MSSDESRILGLFLFTLLIMALAAWACWRFTKRVENPRLRILSRSAILALFLTPSMAFGGHAFILLPAMLVILFFLFDSQPIWAFYFGVVPILVALIAVFIIWISVYEVTRRYRNTESKHKGGANLEI
jgi:protein-S-isoprenylcysteine O-methyltransferase Ste14